MATVAEPQAPTTPTWNTIEALQNDLAHQLRRHDAGKKDADPTCLLRKLRAQLDALLEQEATGPTQKRKFTYASEVEEKPIEWLWEGRLARGCFTLLVGDAGVGKGLTSMAAMRTVTRGGSFPGGPNIPPGGIILMSPEDPASQVIIPRLKAAGVDLTKVLLLSEVDEVDKDGRPYKRPVSFPEDAAILRAAIEDAGASLVIIDPVLSLLSGKVDAHKNHAVRQALAQVLSTAEQYGCAVWGVMHTTKAQHPNVLFRSSSSSAFIEMARIALFFVPDPDGVLGESGVIVNYKNNLARYASSIRYRIHENEHKVGYITWEGESLRPREELLNQLAPMTSGTKSTQELDILAVLKENGGAMTPAQLYEKVKDQTGQNLNAFEVMLKRKLEQGILMRPARGLYTYANNPLYSATKEDVSFVSPVSDVSNVSLPEPSTTMKLTDVSCDEVPTSTPQARKGETYKTYITDIREMPTMLPQPYTDGPKDAQEAAQYLSKWADSPVGYGQIVRTTALSVVLDVMGKHHHLTGMQIPQLRIKQ